jgi:hypothetical protein
MDDDEPFPTLPGAKPKQKIEEVLGKAKILKVFSKDKDKCNRVLQYH